MLGKLAGLAQSAKDMAVDAVASVDMTTVKGALSTTVGAVKDRASDVVDGVGGRLTHPADAYDRALDDFWATVTHDDNGTLNRLWKLKDENPYR